jgi:N-acyl-D-aspartate/D-glutamate deacylase
MSRPLLEKEFVAEAAINPNRIVKFGTTDDFVVQGAAATDFLIGVVEGVAPAAGERCAVVTHGIAEIKLGGTVVRGGLITSDATGRGVAAAPAAANNNRVIGCALASGVLDDIVNVLLSPGSVQG